MEPKLREGFARLHPLGLSFDAWMYFTQLGELIDLARAFPETPIVLNHVGGAIGIGPYAGRRDEVFAEWKGRIEELARCPNVHIKLGGLGMRLFGFDVHEGAMPPSSEQLAAAWRPYIETCIAAFGPERAMFESNFPVDKGSGGYPVFWNAFKRLAAGCSRGREDGAVLRHRQPVLPAGSGVRKAGIRPTVRQSRQKNQRLRGPAPQTPQIRRWPAQKLERSSASLLLDRRRQGRLNRVNDVPALATCWFANLS